MSKIIFSFLALGFSISSAALASDLPTKDQKWRCTMNDQTSAIRLAKELAQHPSYLSKGEGGMHLTDVSQFSVTLKSGQIVDGEVVGSSGNPTDQDSWDLKKTLQAMAAVDKPYSGHDVSVYDSHLEQPKLSAGKIVFGFGYDSYDHYNYVVKLNPKTRTAVIESTFDIDCVGSSSGVAEYDCEVSE